MTPDAPHPGYLLPAAAHGQLVAQLGELLRARMLAEQALRDERRAAREATEAFCLELIDVADMLASQVAFLEAQPADGPAPRLARNLARTRNRLVASLAKRGVVPIPVAAGEPPDYRTCVAAERHDDPTATAERVAAVLREGFMIEGRVLRAAEIAVQVPASG